MVGCGEKGRNTSNISKKGCVCGGSWGGLGVSSFMDPPSGTPEERRNSSPCCRSPPSHVGSPYGKRQVARSLWPADCCVTPDPGPSMEGFAGKRAYRLRLYSPGSQVTGGLEMEQQEGTGHLRPYNLGSHQAGWQGFPAPPHFRNLPDLLLQCPREMRGRDKTGHN